MHASNTTNEGAMETQSMMVQVQKVYGGPTWCVCFVDRAQAHEYPGLCEFDALPLWMQEAVTVLDLMPGAMGSAPGIGHWHTYGRNDERAFFVCAPEDRGEH